MKRNYLPKIALIAGIVGLVSALAIAFELFNLLKFIGEFGSQLNPSPETSGDPMESLLSSGQRISASVFRLLVFHVVVGVAMGSGIICLALDVNKIRHKLKE